MMNRIRDRAFQLAGALLLVTALLLVVLGPLSAKSQTAVTSKKPTISVGIYDRGNIPAEEGTLTDNRWTRWINEHAPVQVTFVPIPRADSIQKYNAMLASGNAPDLILDFDRSFLNQLIVHDQVMPIDELVEQSSTEYKQLLEQYPQVRELATESDGRMYLIAQITGLKTNHSLLIRQDWLDALHLEVPQTTGELYEVAKAFAEQDPDMNGIRDTLGINFSGLGSLLNGQTAGGIRPLDMMFQNVGYIVEDDSLIRAWNRVQAALSYQKQLYQDGIIDPNFLSDPGGEKAKLDFVNGRLGIYWHSSGIEDAYPVIQHLKEKDPSANVRAFALPEGPFGRFNPFAKAPVQMVGAINKQAADPEAVMKFIDFIVSEEGLTTLKFGMEGEHYIRNEAGCYQYTDREKYMKELSWTLDLYMPAARIVLGECNSFAASLNPNDPIDRAYMELEREAERLTLNPDVPFALPIASWPILPPPLQLSLNEGSKALTDIYHRAIVDPGYTAEQAVQDAKASWEQAGGLDVDAYYANWFEEQRGHVQFTRDYYLIK